MIVGYKTPRGKLVMADRAVVRGKRVMTNVVTPRGTKLHPVRGAVPSSP
ncbi:MAG: hypothetical protein QOF76_891 [Solirubrobacteraceae bacterium]|jgi:hypothetical protein|nr:hypothetical protein [Solirubrobacteraceae bacterium]